MAKKIQEHRNNNRHSLYSTESIYNMRDLIHSNEVHLTQLSILTEHEIPLHMRW